MAGEPLSFIPYPPIQKLGVIGDRRTAALIAADGTIQGAFLPSTSMLATAYAMAGYSAKAEAVLAKAEAIAGDLGIFVEEVDGRTGDFLGNHPLLFSQIGCFRAAVETAKRSLLI